MLVYTILAAHLMVSASSYQDTDGSGSDPPLFLYEASTEIPQILPYDEASSLTEPLQVNIAIVHDEDPQAALLQEEKQPTSEVHHINTPASSAEFLVLNVSLPVLPDDLISRLIEAANKASYNEKLDIAVRLTSFTHELMSSIDKSLSSLALS
ncbi:hypothetical protein OESDEN_10005 [Oesophagostomum dentatum]|uniref:Uncharacterized protein n=1 Tax=Oesophagostomum dentatum TaxID=61180 RepID=A0A0B1T475_OESDE|nr:hypothetical protein OESDEN_10005 [Oesophagostomum dentatum]